MAGTQASRHRLYSELGELLSPEAMDEFMDVFPPVGWGEIARRQDITNLEHATRADITTLEHATRADMAELAGTLRTEIADLRTDVHTEIAGLRSEMRTEIASVRAEMRTEFAAVRTEMADMRGDLTAAMRTQLFAMIGAMFTLAGLTWAATSIT